MRSVSVSKARLQSLKALASTSADRQLIELAAVDEASARAARKLTGRCHESAAEEQKRESKMAAALATIESLEQIAKMETLAEISSLLSLGIGDEIMEADLHVEVEKLQLYEEAFEAGLEDAEDMQFEATYVPCKAQYDNEAVDAELELESDFHEALENSSEADVEALAARFVERVQCNGGTIDLSGAGLSDPEKQEELMQILGKGWQEALYTCLHKDAVSLQDADEIDMEHATLLDHAEEMAMFVKHELGADAMLEDEPTDSASLVLLGNLTAKQLTTKLLARNRRRKLRQAAVSSEVAAARRSLQGNIGRSACLTAVLRKYPDIGDKIEAICTDLNVGADASRRDGAITFNVGEPRRKGCGFRRILIELKQRHGIQVSEGALHELRVSRNRRLRMSTRQKGIVNIRLRRSVKRITQDSLNDHCQNAVYRTAHYVRDNCEFDSTLWLERDDHAKLRANAATSAATVTASGEGVSTHQHDFMDAATHSNFYATSYLFPKLVDGGSERFVATVKADRLAPSTPTQHAADFYMLQEMAKAPSSELHSIFYSASGTVKPKVQLEVDGGYDENPTGRETQFLQTELLLGGPKLEKEKRRAQVGSMTREAGGSAKNKVERLNGEETSASAGFHATINDTVVGDLYDFATGQVDQEQLKACWEQVTEEYRSTLDGAPALGGRLSAFHGATEASCPEAAELLARRPILLKWIDPKTSKKARAELELKEPVRTSHFKKVERMREHCETVTHYASTVRCCMSRICQLCRDAPHEHSWYDVGPALKPLPPALRDQERPGHYHDPVNTLQAYAAMHYKPSTFDLKPPSDLALEIYQRECATAAHHPIYQSSPPLTTLYPAPLQPPQSLRPPPHPPPTPHLHNPKLPALP